MQILRFLVVLALLLFMLSESAAVEAAATARRKPPAALSKESVNQLLQAEEHKRNAQLHGLQVRLQRKIVSMRKHLESIMQKLEVTEAKLHENVQQVNVGAKKKLHAFEVQFARQYSSNWRIPFIVLAMLLFVLGAFFTKLYFKAVPRDDGKRW